MRRVILAVFGTVTGLVALLSFKTHPAAIVSAPAAVSTTAPGSTATNGTATNGTATNGTTTNGTTTNGTTTSAAPPSTGSSSTASAGAKATSSATATTSSSSTSKAATTRAATGTAADTRYGPVQVRIVVTNGKLSSVTAVEYPNNNPRDQQINASAIPELNQEALTAGTAEIDMVSGATYTSQGYLDSLQSALDNAGL